jgi:hypothetical protein
MKLTRIILMLVLACALAGCGNSKISKENYDKIKEGMTKTEVIAILGEPTGSETVGQINDKEIKGSVWESGSIKIVTMFSDAGKLEVKRLDKE